jgi:hypothetical protein
MHPKLAYAIVEWSAGLLIGLIPLLSHLLVNLSGDASSDGPGSWTIDVLLVAIMTSGLSAVTLFTRLARGTVSYSHIKPHSMFLMATNMIAFLLSGVLFGQVSSHGARDFGLTMPAVFLILAMASSLYFEILIAIEAIAADEG